MAFGPVDAVDSVSKRDEKSLLGGTGSTVENAVDQVLSRFFSATCVVDDPAGDGWIRASVIHRLAAGAGLHRALSSPVDAVMWKMRLPGSRGGPQGRRAWPGGTSDSPRKPEFPSGAAMVAPWSVPRPRACRIRCGNWSWRSARLRSARRVLARQSSPDGSAWRRTSLCSPRRSAAQTARFAPGRTPRGTGGSRPSRASTGAVRRRRSTAQASSRPTP